MTNATTEADLQKQQKAKEARELQEKMIKYLEEKWNLPELHWSCCHCLKEAYMSEVEERDGYVTDEDLIESSGGKLHSR